MFVTIDNRVCVKTGDLARYNERGELVHAGRVDFQIKMRGQRVETAEIENTIIDYCPSKISNCLVMKVPQKDDSLVAYVASSDLALDIEEISNHCKISLHQYMIPSYFVLLDKLPVNANGKTDRAQLPVPSLLNCISNTVIEAGYQLVSKDLSTTPELSSTLTTSNDHFSPDLSDELEVYIHSLWCQTLSYSTISTKVNFFHIGGHSLLLMQMYYNYKMTLNIDMKSVDVTNFLQNPTIADHARFLREALNDENKYDNSSSQSSHIQGINFYEKCTPYLFQLFSHR